MVKRYDLVQGYDGADPFEYIDYHEDGDYVRFEDYEELREQLARVTKQLYAKCKPDDCWIAYKLQIEDLKKEIEELKKNAVR